MGQWPAGLFPFARKLFSQAGKPCLTKPEAGLTDRPEGDDEQITLGSTDGILVH